MDDAIHTHLPVDRAAVAVVAGLIEGVAEVTEGIYRPVKGTPIAGNRVYLSILTDPIDRRSHAHGN